MTGELIGEVILWLILAVIVHGIYWFAVSRGVSERAEAWIAAQERAGQAIEQAQHQAEYAGRQVRRGARRARSGFEDFIDENPLAAGALALGVGALVGSLFPSTDLEDEWMGSRRDQVVGRAREAAGESLDRGKDVAERVAGEAREAAKHAGRAAKDPDHAEEHMRKAGSQTKNAVHEAQRGAGEIKDETQRQVDRKTP